MKVLLVNKFLYPKGGSEKYLFELADLLMKNGHQIEYFGMNTPQNIVDTPKEYLVNNIDFHQKSLSTLLYPYKIIYSREARGKIGRLIEQFKPDIVHLNNYNFQLTPSIIYELKKFKIPAVQTVHDPILVCPAHSLYNFQTREICEKCKGRKYSNCIKTKCIHGSALRSVLGAFEGYLYYKLKTYDYINHFICPSQFIAEKMVEFGINPVKIEVLPNFIRETYPLENIQKKKHFLYFGRISEEKGIRVLVEASRLLQDIKFVIAGSGPLEYLLTGLPNVEFVGFKQGEGLRKIIRQSIATICPSLWYENSPLSVLESLGLNIPVIGANIGGIPELVEDKWNGLLFEAGNVDDLASKIKYLSKQEELVKYCSKNCIQSSRRLSIDKYYSRIFGIYEKAIKERSGLL